MRHRIKSWVTGEMIDAERWVEQGSSWLSN